MLYSFLSADKIESPLPFYDAISVFNDGLALFVSSVIVVYILFILFDVRLVFTTLNQSSLFIFGAQVKCRATFAGAGFIMF